MPKGRGKLVTQAKRRSTDTSETRVKTPSYGPPQKSAHDPYSSMTFEELVKAQGVKPLDDPSVLAGVWPEDDDIDEFIEDLYRSRRA